MCALSELLCPAGCWRPRIAGGAVGRGEAGSGAVEPGWNDGKKSPAALFPPRLATPCEGRGKGEGGHYSMESHIPALGTAPRRATRRDRCNGRP